MASGWRCAGLAFRLLADRGDSRADRKSKRAFKAATAAGGQISFFTRLGLALARLEGAEVEDTGVGDADLFAAWDKLIDYTGTEGPQFEKWAQGLHGALTSGDHDTVARAIARVGSELLGLEAEARQATSGEEDAFWDLPAPPRTLCFEVKMAPTVKAISNTNVTQAEGAVRALETEREHPARGLLVTPYEAVDKTAIARLDRVRLLTVDILLEGVEELLDLLREFRRHWDQGSKARTQARAAVVDDLPPRDWFWRAAELADDWVTGELLDAAFEEGSA